MKDYLPLLRQWSLAVKGRNVLTILDEDMYSMLYADSNGQKTRHVTGSMWVLSDIVCLNSAKLYDETDARQPIPVPCKN